MDEKELAVRRVRLNVGTMLVGLAHLMYDTGDEKLTPDGLAVLSIGLRIQGDSLEGTNYQQLVESGDWASGGLATPKVQ